MDYDSRFDLRELNLKGGEQAERSFNVDLQPIELGGQTYQVVSAPDGVVLRVNRAAGGFVVTVRVAARVYGACMRCLKEVVLDIEAQQQEFAPTTQEQWEDADISPYIDNLVVDVPALAREALVLALPDKILCRPDCQGLCPVCGEDRNVVSCDCGEPSFDPRLEVLRQFRPEP